MSISILDQDNLVFRNYGVNLKIKVKFYYYASFYSCITASGYSRANNRAFMSSPAAVRVSNGNSR